MNVNGMTGTIELSEDSVIVQRKGKIRWRKAELAIEKRIPFGQVVGVHIRPAGPLKRGCHRVHRGWVGARRSHDLVHPPPATGIRGVVTSRYAEGRGDILLASALGRRGFAEEASLSST